MSASSTSASRSPPTRGSRDLGSWGPQGQPTKRVSGYREGVPIELIWWSRTHAEEAVDAIFAGRIGGTADALANGVALRTYRPAGRSGRSGWATTRRSSQLREIEDAALTWGGFAAGGLPDDRPARRAAVACWSGWSTTRSRVDTHRLRAQPRLAADDEAPRGARRAARGQARPSRRADRRGPDRARSAPSGDSS